MMNYDDDDVDNLCVTLETINKTLDDMLARLGDQRSTIEEQLQIWQAEDKDGAEDKDATTTAAAT